MTSSRIRTRRTKLGFRLSIMLLSNNCVFKDHSSIVSFILRWKIDTSAEALKEHRRIPKFGVFHEQLPLPVPCYDLVPVTKFTLGHAQSHRLCVPPAPLTWRAVSTRLENVFTAVCWPAITSDSNFMRSSCRPQSELRVIFRISSGLLLGNLLCHPLYHVCSPGHQGPRWPRVVPSFLPPPKRESGIMN